jgi:hypothetical protein
MTDASHPGGEKPRIIIDEDWKSQVQAEKEALKQPSSQPSPQEPVRQASHEQDRGALPPATFPVLLTTLATQALVSLGQIPHPATNQPEIRLDEAKHFIELLEMLEQKTTGNRTPDESQLLENLLHELRLGYVTSSKAAAK